MISNAHTFQKQSSIVSTDKEHRQRLQYNIGEQYRASFEKCKTNFQDIEKAKQSASELKQHVLDNLDTYLVRFEERFSERGGKVLWAANSREVGNLLSELFKQTGTKKVVKGKSMTSEEIEFNEFCEERSVEPIETDLGEFIIQLEGTKPYHIVTPAIHKSKEDVAELFHQKFGTSSDATPEDMAQFARQKLRNEFLQADMGVTGANFVLAEEGAVAITENEGNNLLATSVPKRHVVIAGIEKVLPSMHDLALFWTLLPTHGTGQLMSSYNSLFFGAKQAGESDGPEEMYVILLDNERSSLLKDKDINEALKCIRCGSCLNHCPIYLNVGGHTYNSVYTGPIGSVIMPHLKSLKEYGHLSFACTLCGRCTEECPVKVPLHQLLLKNRMAYAKEGNLPILWKIGLKLFALFGRNSFFWSVPASFKNAALALVPNLLGKNKKLPHLPSKAFRQRNTG